jgi:hypothetical protein
VRSSLAIHSSNVSLGITDDPFPSIDGEISFVVREIARSECRQNDIAEVLAAHRPVRLPRHKIVDCEFDFRGLGPGRSLRRLPRTRRMFRCCLFDNRRGGIPALAASICSAPVSVSSRGVASELRGHAVRISGPWDGFSCRGSWV